MPTSPSISRCLPLSHSSANNSFTCTADIAIDYEKKSESAEKKSLKRQINRGHALLRKHVQRPILVHAQRTGRRRYTFSGYQDNKIVYKKRRRFTSIAWPTKFLLGGSITDPLNLRSLEDEKVNQQLNAFSPASSPMPIPPWRSQVQVIIPSNIYDPLNLNAGEEVGMNLLNAKSRRRRRHRKSRRDEHDIVVDAKDLSPVEELSRQDLETQLLNASHSPQKYSEQNSVNSVSLVVPSDVSTEKVENVLPENEPEKASKLLSSGPSKECDENSAIQKQVLKRRRSKTRLQKADTMKFRANAEKFCYGNHLTTHCNWNFDHSTNDPRIAYLSEDLFQGKDVLDIGCNSGNLSLLIARRINPKKVIGIDIDKKLVNIAQRKLRRMSRGIMGADMPQSMPFLYGPLAKLLQMKHPEPVEFPHNVTFLEANYVPACEDYLDTQKPEYDTILCLRVTKWIHLNFGDEGLKMAFKRMYAQLRIGGHLILEPQPWFTYSASKKITPSIYKTYCSLQIRPDSFCEYLLSNEVGFSSCELIGRSTNYAKGYRQNIYLLTKGYHDAHADLIANDLSPIPYHDDQWTMHSDHHYDGMSDYLDTSSEYSDANLQMSDI